MALLSRRRRASSPVRLPRPLPAIASPWASSDALTWVTFAGLFDGADLSNFPVSRREAIALPVIARGRDLIVQSAARLDLFAATAAGRLPAQPRPIAQPEVGRARFITLVWTFDALLFDGYAVWEVAQRYAEDGRPMTFRFAPNSTVELDDVGNIAAVNGREVGPFDTVRFDAPHEGLLTRAAESIRIARAIQAAYSRAAKTPTPDVELHQTGGEPMTDDEIDALIQRWVDARSGKNAGVAYTGQTIQAVLHGQQPETLLIAARKACDLDLIRHMNLPAWAADVEVGGSSLTYSNVPSRARELVDYTLAGYLEAVASRLSLDDVLAAGIWSSFNTDALTEGDFADRMKAYTDAVNSKVYTAEQLANRERGVPLEGPTA